MPTSYVYKLHRRTILEHYGGIPPRCACYGEDFYPFLVIDHIDPNRMCSSGRGPYLYKWILGNNFPDGFQVLCHNCNMAKGCSKDCPHKKIRSLHFEEFKDLIGV